MYVFNLKTPKQSLKNTWNTRELNNKQRKTLMPTTKKP